MVVTNTMQAVVLADCRLTGTQGSKPVVFRDVCQKMASTNGWSLVSFAGDNLCLARFLADGLLSRLRRSEPHQVEWLADDDQLRAFVRLGVQEHIADRPLHNACAKSSVELMVTWMDHTRSIQAGTKPGEPGWEPGVQVTVITTPRMAIRRTQGFGIEAIGSGAVLTEHIDHDLKMKLITFGGGPDRTANVHRCFFTAEVCRTELERLGVETVGGLYQLAYLSRRGVGVVPYFYWVDVAPGRGTYVAMRFEGGQWLQEHRPSNTSIQVVSPNEIELKGPKWRRGRHEMFDARNLKPDSPGVIPATSPLLPMYVEYEVDPLPTQVAASWGPAPLAAQTWAPANPAAMSRRQMRRDFARRRKRDRRR
jgi:hypothetical protein